MVAEKKPRVAILHGEGGLVCMVEIASGNAMMKNGFVIASERERCGLSPDAVRARAKWLSDWFGCPLVDETKQAEPEPQKPDATEELRAEIDRLRSEVGYLRNGTAAIWEAIARINRKVQP